MYRIRIIPGLLLSTALVLGGCASDGSSLLTTGSLAMNDTQVASSERISPECMNLMATIQELRKEGTPERVEKISTTGKSSTVNIKRAALTKLTELDKANAEFQMKCSKLAPTEAAPAPAPAPTETAAAAAQQPAAAAQ